MKAARRRASPTGRGKVILAVGAHPDDLDFGCSGTVAKFVKEGASAYYVICTNGSKGSDDPKMTSQKLTQIRKKEQFEAAKVLGIKKVFFFNHEDGELENNIELKEEITKIIRKVRPDTVFTVDPLMIYSQKRGYINHPDHRACGQAVLDAVYPLSRDRLTFPHHQKERLKPHKVKEIYLVNFDTQYTFFDISTTIDLKLKALLKHKSQVSKESLQRVKEWASRLGKKKGYKFAEGFKKIILKF